MLLSTAGQGLSFLVITVLLCHAEKNADSNGPSIATASIAFLFYLLYFVRNRYAGSSMVVSH